MRLRLRGSRRSSTCTGRTTSALVRLAVLVGADRSVAEELVQDAFVATHRTWDGVRDPLAYLRRTVVNRCHSWGRRQTMERVRRPAPAPDAASAPTSCGTPWPPSLTGSAPPSSLATTSISPTPTSPTPRLPPRHRPHRHPPRPRRASQGRPPMTDQLETDLRTMLADACLRGHRRPRRRPRGDRHPAPVPVTTALADVVPARSPPAGLAGRIAAAAAVVAVVVVGAAIWATTDDDTDRRHQPGTRGIRRDLHRRRIARGAWPGRTCSIASTSPRTRSSTVTRARPNPRIRLT